MDLFKSMQALVYVADQEGFAAAGRVLGLSKAQVSRLVSRLEEHLGVRLLQRTTRRLSLTDEGERYLAYAREVIENNDRIEGELGDRRVTPRGRLRVNAPLSYGERYIGPLLPGFMSEYPEVDLEVSLTDRFVDLLEEGFDVAIRIGGDPGSNLISRRLGQIEHGLYASPDYVARKGRVESVEDFNSHNCLVYSIGGGARPWVFGGNKLDVKPSLVSTNGDVLRCVAVAGVGLTMLPGFIVEEDVRAGRLINLLDENSIDEARDTLPIMAVYPERKHLPFKTRAFIDYLAKELGSSAQ